jgi:hypothetical protein
MSKHFAIKMTPQRKHEIAPFTSTNTNNLTSLTDGTGYRDIFTDQLAIPVLKLLNRAINFSFAIQPVKFVLEYLKV